PNGFNILSHKKHHPQRNILDELSPPFDLTTLFKLFYKHVREAHLRGESGETVVDAVRSQTQIIWQQLSLEDKKRFMAHLRHLWGVARHRLPGDIHGQIQSMIANRSLQVMAGRISDINEADGFLEVKIALRGSDKTEIVKVQRIINCTGPLTDITKFKSELYSGLLRKKFIQPDEMKLGIDATADGRIIDENGKASNSIFTLGSLLKGKLWESTAVPELRKQAELLADILLAK
ncbi:MAG: FAD/NAD(P)-binding protein, partial [Bacteroidota bacterium]